MKKQTSANWKEVVMHIDTTWKKAKKTEYGYPFTGRDFVDLKHFVRIYQPWGIMGLWDVYLETANEWILDKGLSIYQFTRSLPRLTDNTTWKHRATQYERQLCGGIPNEMQGLLKNILKP